VGTYGAWIDDRAEVHLLEGRLQHSRICDYSDAHVCGWVGVVVFKPDSEGARIGFRFNPRTVTVAALISCVHVVEYNKGATFMFDDAFAQSHPLPEGHERTHAYGAKEAARYLDDLRFWKRGSSYDTSPMPTVYPKKKGT